MNVDSTIAEKNLSIASEYYRLFYDIKGKDRVYSGGTTGFIPFKITITLDGIAGFKIYQKLQVNTRFLPPGYPTTSEFIITGINHKLKDNDWESELTVILIPKFEEFDTIITTDSYSYVKPPEIKPVTSPTINAPTGTAADNEYFIFQYLKTIGWSKIQVAAAMGNMEHETIRTFSPDSFNPRDSNGSTDYGIIQWNSQFKPADGSNPGQSDLVKSKEMIKAIVGGTLQEQLDYLLTMSTVTKWLANPIYHADVATSTWEFASIVEVCDQCNKGRSIYESSYQFPRTANAEKIYQRFNSSNDRLYWP